MAIDHRDSLRRAASRRGVVDASAEFLSTFKRQVISELCEVSTCVMVDPEFGRTATSVDVLPADVALIMPLEASGYESISEGFVTAMDPAFSPETALRNFGADACKLLLPYRADDETTCARQDAALAEALDLSHTFGMPLVVEPVVYRRAAETESDYENRFPVLLIDAIARVATQGPDLLKIQFPRSVDGRAAEAMLCRRITKALGGIPWVLLGGDADFDEVKAELTIAIAEGAAGFLVGRALWGDALVVPEKTRPEFIRSVTLPRFKQLTRIALEVRTEP